LNYVTIGCRKRTLLIKIAALIACALPRPSSPVAGCVIQKAGTGMSLLEQHCHVAVWHDYGLLDEAERTLAGKQNSALLAFELFRPMLMMIDGPRHRNNLY
jgi:hypothetical protein